MLQNESCFTTFQKEISLTDLQGSESARKTNFHIKDLGQKWKWVLKCHKKRIIATLNHSVWPLKETLYEQYFLKAETSKLNLILI